MMLKKIGIFFILFLVMGCSKGNNIDASKEFQKRVEKSKSCLLYTSDAADE
mgnify:CR=1 FL=1